MGGASGEAGDQVRVGSGYDSHRFAKGRKLILGGLEIPAAEGLLGHSDADVLVHAICDALLGAIGEGDLGHHFPDTDQLYKDISSLKILEAVRGMLKAKGFQIENVDSTIIAERPRLALHIPAMSKNIARTLDIPAGCVNVKATTNEGMGFIGRGEGIAALATVLLMENEGEGKLHDR